jgi:nucleoside-diphosphate-sugar epimerase
MERIAVLGATGYLGRRLVSELLRAGFFVRAIARSVEKLRCRPYAASPHLEITRADACREEEQSPFDEGVCRLALDLKNLALTWQPHV